MRSVLIPLFAAAIAIAPSVAPAQTTEVLRGRVISDSGRVVKGASVIITRGPDRLVQSAVTSDSGTFRIAFENGTGDYLVAIQATGYKPARRRVTRQGSEREFVVDFTLSSNVVSLDAVKVQANKPVRVSTYVSASSPDAGSSERFNEGVVGGISPTDAGNIINTVSTIPGGVMAGGGLSMLGANSSSNLTTLNGMAMGGGTLPRAARVDTRVTGATFDATRGGFSGANIDVRLGAGSRNYQNRSVFTTFDGTSLQATDAIGRALGVTNTNWRASAGMDGEAIRNALTYNIAVDASRNTRIRPDLLGADPLAYELSGVAVDSVRRVRTLAAQNGLPLTFGGVSSGIRRDALSAVARLDDTRDTARTHSLVLYVNESRADNEGIGTLSAPSVGSERLDRAAGAQWSLGRYSGPGLSHYRNSRLNVSSTLARTTPFDDRPAVDVLVRTLADATATDAGIAALSLGGRGLDESTSRRSTGEASHEEWRNFKGRRHQVKAIVWGRVDGMEQEGGALTNGRYAFASLGDFAANRPSSYSRTLSNPDRRGESWNSAAAVSHTYNPSRFFSLLYGLRLEGNGLFTTPGRNETLERTLGVSTGGVSPVVHVSPRIGFSYTFNKSARNGGGMSMNNFGTWYRQPTGVLRGGIGEFRDLWRPDAVAEAAARTGLAGSALALTCVGDAVPQGDWSIASSVPRPSQCRDGSSALAERAPQVTLLGRGYDAPRSWRANLDFNTTRWNLMLRASALGTYDLNQASIIDANFGGNTQFTLASEGNRPVFVSPGAIDATSGVVSAAESRRSADFGRVSVLQSDLRGRGGQLSIGLGPDRFNRFWRNWPFWSANYTLQRIDRQVRGFDGAASGDPRAVEWAPGWSDARHVWLLQLGHQGKLGSFSAFARLQSGLPFTPLVQGDVNGDGRSGDRAYVPNPATSTDITLASGIRALQNRGSAVAQECLARSIANPLARNECRGPWTRTLNVTWAPPTAFLGKSWQSRVNMTVFANNVLGGIDQLVHGADNMRGWGGVASPDATLLIPRGFDAATRAFRYDVNPRFAETRPSRTTWREPFRVSIDVNVRLHVDYDVQTLRRVLEPVRMNGTYARRGVDSLLSRYLNETSSIHRAVVFEADSLFLRPDQIDKLRQRDSVFAEQVRAIYRPLAEYLAAVPEGKATAEALAKAKAAQDAYWALFWKQPELAAEALESQQIDLMSLLKDMLTIPQGKRTGARFYFGSGVTLKHSVAQVRKD